MTDNQNIDLGTKTEDKLGRMDSISKLTSMIIAQTPKKKNDDGYVLSLNASYGDGKTTFVKLWQEYLESPNQYIDASKDYVVRNYESTLHEGHKSIYINTWKYDFHTDPLTLICYELDNAFAENDNKELTVLLKKIAAYGAAFASQLLQRNFGLNASKAVQDVDKMVGVGGGIFEDLKNKISAIEEVKNFLLAEVKKLNGKNLFIFVDELDRARPDYAIDFLEIIKHIFSVKGIVFIISVDEKSLKSIVEKKYGYNIDFDGYFRRFVKMTYSMPSMYDQKIYKYTPLQDNYNFRKLIKHYKVKLRDINTLEMYNEIMLPNGKGGAHLLIFNFLSILKVCNNKKYKELISNIEGGSSLLLKEAVYIKDTIQNAVLTDVNRGDWCLKVFFQALLGSGIEGKEREELREIFGLEKEEADLGEQGSLVFMSKEIDSIGREFFS